MSSIGPAFAVLTLISGAVCGLFGAYLMRRTGAVGGHSLALVFLGAGVWGLTYGVELFAVGSHRELWGALKYVGIVLIPPAWLTFALQYTGRERFVTPRLLALLAVQPIAVLMVLAIPGTRDLIRAYPPGDSSALVVVELGPLFYALFAYSAGVVAIGTCVLVMTLLRISPAYRRQSLVLVGAIALAWTADILATLGVGIFSVLDPTPIAIAVAGAMVFAGVFRFRLLDLVPVARTTLFETMPDPVVVLDPHGRVIDHNAAARHVLGTTRSGLLGVRLEQVIGAELPAAGVDRPTRHELGIGGPDDPRSYELLMSVLGSSSDGPGQLVVLRDITARKEAERLLKRLAHFDEATGLPNRALFRDRLDTALAHQRRRGGSLAVLFLDLDHFKSVNDSLGHDAGDEVLVAVARRLQSVVRNEDTLARFGGDEFSLLLPEVEPTDGPLAVAEKILAALAEPLTVRDAQLAIHASIGIAVYPRDGDDQSSLLRRSDLAMYEAKAHGGNQARLASTS